MIGQIEKALLPKGTREQNLSANLRKSGEAVFESTKKLEPIETDLTPPRDDDDEMDDDEDEEEKDKVEEVVAGAPRPDPRGSWSREVALRVDKYILDQVEALEDKVAAASMQVPVRESRPSLPWGWQEEKLVVLEG